MAFGDNLKRLRTNKEFTQEYLGKVLCLSRTTISNYEKGKMQPSIETLIKLSEIFNVTVDELIKQYKNPPCSTGPRTERNHLHRVQMMQFNAK